MKTMCEIKYEWHTNRLKKQRNDSLKTRYTYKNTKEKRKRTFYRCSDLSKRWGKTMSWLCVPYNVLSVADDCLKSERVQEQPAAMLSKQTLHGVVGCNAMQCIATNRNAQWEKWIVQPKPNTMHENDDINTQQICIYFIIIFSQRHIVVSYELFQITKMCVHEDLTLFKFCTFLADYLRNKHSCLIFYLWMQLILCWVSLFVQEENALDIFLFAAIFFSSSSLYSIVICVIWQQTLFSECQSKSCCLSIVNEW